MNSILFVIICSLLIFFATMFGSISAIFINKYNKNSEKMCLGLASGVMFASAIWSLLLPSIESSNFLFVIISFIIGIMVIIILDKLVKIYSKENTKKNNMLFIAMTLHNIPEGMTVGLMCTYAYQFDSAISISMALALTIGIAIQNIPEGSAVSLSYRQLGYSKFTSFILGTISGIVEPISALLMYALFNILSPLLPFVLASAAGIMIYVVVNELMPNISNEDSNLSSISFVIGFLVTSKSQYVFWFVYQESKPSIECKE